MSTNNNGRKDDGGKLRWDLLPLPLVEKLVEVYTFGAKKYAPNTWQNLDDGYNRYKAAMLRHLTAYEKGETIDPDSKLNHLYHTAWNALALIHFAEREQEKPILSQYITNELSRIAHEETLEPPFTFAFSIGEHVSLVGHSYAHDFITKREILSQCRGNIYFTPNFGWCYEKDIEHYQQQKQPTK